MTQYWLMKSEPEVFSFGDLKIKKTSFWDGVRNYVARNHMMKDMKIGDFVLFYHSSSKPSGVAGIAKVTALAKPDPTQFDPKSEYYDAKSPKEKPRWYGVEVSHHKDLEQFVSVDQLKKKFELKNMMLFKNSRLSVQAVTPEEFSIIVEMAKTKQRSNKNETSHNILR